MNLTEAAGFAMPTAAASSCTTALLRTRLTSNTYKKQIFKVNTGTLTTAFISDTCLSTATWDSVVYVLSCLKTTAGNLNAPTSCTQCVVNDDTTNCGPGGTLSRMSRISRGFSTTFQYYVVVTGFNTTMHGAYTLRLN